MPYSEYEHGKQHRKNSKLKRTHLLLAILFFVLLSSTVVAVAKAQTDDNGGGGESDFEFHCSLGGWALILIYATLGVGFLVSGRFGRIARLKPLPIHKLIAVVLAVYLTGEVLFGLIMRGIVFVQSLHGVLGFSVAALSWIVAGLNPKLVSKVVKWKNASRIHLVFAVILFLLLIFHLSYAFSVLE